MCTTISCLTHHPTGPKRPFVQSCFLSSWLPWGILWIDSFYPRCRALHFPLLYEFLSTCLSSPNLLCHSALQHLNFSFPQFGILHELTESTSSPILQIINEVLDLYQPQFLSSCWGTSLATGHQLLGFELLITISNLLVFYPPYSG